MVEVLALGLIIDVTFLPVAQALLFQYPIAHNLRFQVPSVYTYWIYYLVLGPTQSQAHLKTSHSLHQTLARHHIRKRSHYYLVGIIFFYVKSLIKGWVHPQKVAMVALIYTIREWRATKDTWCPISESYFEIKREREYPRTILLYFALCYIVSRKTLA
jgi:hypothetical protein